MTEQFELYQKILAECADVLMGFRAIIDSLLDEARDNYPPPDWESVGRAARMRAALERAERAWQRIEGENEKQKEKP
jgi:hypothetical protein